MSRRQTSARALTILICAAAVAAPAISSIGCQRRDTAPKPEAGAPAGEMEPVPDLADRIRKLPKTVIDYDRSLLTEGERAVLAKAIEAAKTIEEIYWLQVSEKNPEWRTKLAAAAPSSPKMASALQYFDAMKGPWDRVMKEEPFIPAAGAKPSGAGYYPADMTKEEFEKWVADHPADAPAFQGLFSVIRRGEAGLVAVPYSKQYEKQLTVAAAKLREAAALTDNATLRDFFEKRAAAFLSDDYYASDVAWMDLAAPIDVVIGPYEVYEDKLFNYKAAFESFVTVVDKPESEKLAIYAQHLPEMERLLPMPDEHKNFNRGTDSPIRVVQVAFTAGDSRSGVQTAAFNLPNDEKVRNEKGSKKVLLKNVMDAKFRMSGNPIGLGLLDPSQTSLISFKAYFNHVLFHELSHGLGPGIIKGPDGKEVENRILLKELYTPIEECKADVLGMWNLRYAMTRQLLSEFSAEELYVTDFGVELFRGMRFGIDEAHGRGSAVQWNWYREKGAIVPTTEGRFRVDFDRSKGAIATLAQELLMIEATGDYARAKKLLDTYGVENDEIRGVIERLSDIPVDITPVYPAAGENP